jgi:hypothetical protein
MFNLTDLVSDILLEIDGTAQGQPVPQTPKWLTDLINHHNKIFGTNIQINELNSLYGIGVAESRVNQKDMPVLSKSIHLLVVLRSIIANNTATKTTRPKTLQQFISQFPDGDNQSIQVTTTADVLKLQNEDQWKIEDFDAVVAKAYQTWLEEANKMTSAALETYGNEFILPAVQKIIANRISVWDRLTRLKSPTQPFTNLITDVFKYPKEYIAGKRKVSGDFPDIVDDLYLQNLFSVGLEARNFFAAEILRLKTQPDDQAGSETDNQQQNQNQQQTNTNPQNLINPNQEFSDSLNLFDTYYNSILIQEGPIGNFVQNVKNVAGAVKGGIKQAVQTKNPQAFKQEFQKLQEDLNNLMFFVTGKSIKYKKINPDTLEETGQTGDTDPKNYTVSSIMKMKSQEAINLIRALRDIAMYTKKKTGAGQAIGKAAGALGALRVGMGPVN